jgi:hypothetical protein
VIYYHKYLYMFQAYRWAYRCPKHVEIFMIINHNCIKLVHLIIFIYDARSHKHQMRNLCLWHDVAPIGSLRSFAQILVCPKHFIRAQCELHFKSKNVNVVSCWVTTSHWGLFLFQHQRHKWT